MPLKGWVCPPTSPTAGNRNQIDHCLGTCPHPCVSPPLLAAMYAAEHDNHHVGTYISSSMLASNSCSRQTWYERNFDFYESPKRRYWPFRGTLYHSVIEAAAGHVEQYGWLQELRMSVDIEYPEYPMPMFDNGKFTGDFDTSKNLMITVGGTTDAYRYHPTHPRLDDFKTSADAKVKMVIEGNKGGTFSKNVDDAWVWQTNIYSWLISKTPITQEWRDKLKASGLKVPKKLTHFPRPKSLHIQLLGMMEIPITGATYQPLRDWKSYDLDPIPVLPEAEVEAFVREQAIKWHRYLVLGEKPPIVPVQNKWMCKSCLWNGEKVEGGICFPEAERPLTRIDE